MIYSKRIGFLVSAQTLIPHGGIGQFTKSFCELMHDHNIKVDLIVDKQPQNTDFLKSLKANIICPDNSLSYADHSAIFMYEDSYCYERMVNFRNATIKALTTNIYDALICNTFETVQVASTMGLDECIQIIAYTHLESQIFPSTKNPFLCSVNEMMRLQTAKMSNITIGTQSRFNKVHFADATFLPIPLPEKELILQEYNNPREGVLFIGRWEEGKNPELYIELIKQSNLPARVMTNANGAKKFEDRFKSLGITDYKIATSVIGQEKIDFITSCRVAFNPSTVESYGLAFLEQIIQLPTFALENQRWTMNFPERRFSKTSKKTMVSDITEAYNKFDTAEKWYDTGSIKFFADIEKLVFHEWNKCFNDFVSKQSNTNTAKICNEKTVKYADFILGLKRRIVCIDDIKSVLSNKHKFRVIYTDADTYLTKDPMFEPEEEVIGQGLFEFG